MLKLNQLIKIYENGHQAVKGINLDVKAGEFIVLVGPSGCGKSSILRSIAGLEAITSGSIELDGRRVDPIKPAARDIAMVFQNYALYPHMTVYDNLAYGLKNRGVEKSLIDRKIRRVATTLKIEDYLDRKPAKLSGGQRQRVAMGRAIVRDPKLFLFDEPLSNLDAALRAHMRLEIKKLQRELGVTSVYVTHDQVEAMTLADRIVVLNQGEIEQVGTPSEIYHQPQSEFVASFIGSPAINLLPATLSGGQLVLSNGQTCSVPAYAHLPDQHIKVGIRPEQLSLTTDAHPLRLDLAVQVVEPLGPNQLVHGQLLGQMFTAVTPEQPLALHQSLPVYIDPDKLHLFDSQGQRLLPRLLQATAS
ncbi:sn-glycerol-3-phosphate ABC transporter ATP-binding protein UgpC [Photobacterium galatheae]|uniref:Sugar ABC transporter ATPase n=2 Tax=Photobacterium galatheae TaxID=1654360 RepID=A0A066RR08_9GAMM|nr:sn-glycerol-3-phosphate ABC transporter ATP-binding protein UgpC [Photobacterium galatheae]KDM90107.1 sugar ABC transporter ATPase [Photobacterium galatheae]MCM0151628.1 sn-glycerol-3-phosphate ABC transporter ATP-binding protein UgpC [Photobacterium galatheae]